jgi:WD40 repeat protein
LRDHTDAVFAVAFHATRKQIASLGWDRVILLWNVATGEEVTRLQGHRSYIYALAFSPDSAALASSSGDGTVRLWDTVPLSERLKAGRDTRSSDP